ncbi:unnamed protein product [Didymodactylos carnosus]|uniref:Uncharacterized protein n=1 Tax=Didymodactylos carnosus TaxID=1234261 RepID=A0A815UT66_9BILA|nr:unnamed protein product [Didymodactylos carnosus]CAF1518218.1 unnamed protein product [Didymodactylos carnosus]CAF3703517.1 unnamed protein product [Didymodactylos carnosus]CAF4377894.1 unnamed protein product [Didymodactylos carnosus]
MGSYASENFFASKSYGSSKVINIFLSTCVACQARKALKIRVLATAIVSVDSLTRFEIDLIDFRKRPDGDYK